MAPEILLVLGHVLGLILNRLAQVQMMMGALLGKAVLLVPLLGTAAVVSSWRTKWRSG